MRGTVGRAAVCGLWVALCGLVGCQQPAMDMSEMRPPERPEALKRLDVFVGTWVGTSEMHVPGQDEPIKAEGKDVISWGADGWALVENFSVKFGDQTMHGLGLWTWNPRKNRYDVYWVDSSGGVARGEVRFDEDSGKWYFRGKGVNPYSGQTTRGEGWMRIVDENTMEWQHVEWDAWRLKKLAEMRGTSRRQP